MDSRIKSDDSIWSAAARRPEKLHERRVERMEEASAINAQDTGDKPKEETASVRVVLSDDALERAAKARQGITELSHTSSQSDKDAARAKLAEIKQRIKMLKMMLSMMGPSAAKGIIAELRQLAGQLSQVAATLQSGTGGGGGMSVAPMTAPVVHGAGAAAGGAAGMGAMGAGADMGMAGISAATGADASGAGASEAGASAPGASDAASAATASGAEASGATTAAAAAAAAPASGVTQATTAATPGTGQAEAPDVPGATAASANAATADTAETAKANDDQDATTSSSVMSSALQERHREARQRQADARAVKELIQELKALREAAERMLRQQGESDAKQFGDIDAALSKAEQSAQALNSSGDAMPTGSGAALAAALPAVAPGA